MAKQSKTSLQVDRMGEIKDGSVSGTVPAPAPEASMFAVHYPGYPSSLSRAIHTLGGFQALHKARSLSSHRLELRFRPGDPFSHPTFGDLRPCNNFLLKLSKSKDQHYASIVGRVHEAYHFEGMADYQHVVAVHADAARTKKRRLDDPPSEKNSSMDVDDEDVMILVPPLFAPKDVPENLVLKPSVTSSAKKSQEAVVQPEWEIDMEPVLAIDFNIKEIPKRINWEDYISQGTEQWESQMAVLRLFDERPIWIKHSLNERLVDQGYNFASHMLRRLLSRVAYYFSSGPFLRFWIKKGYDPRKDPESRIYQRIDFRVHQSLRSFCDANTASQANQRWEEICAFRVFPLKCQTSLQLFELNDDYIHQEIRKLPTQKTCTYATGWFSHAVLNNLRHRITIKFLSVYPKPCVTRLLKEATDNFEKSKRRLQKASLIVHEENQKEVDAVVGSEDDEEPDNVDDEDDEEEEIEVENDQEGDDEISLRSHSYMNVESLSRSHLQDLFGSFPTPSAELGGGGDIIQNASSDEDEYQIFEQDSDAIFSDDEDDY